MKNPINVLKWLINDFNEKGIKLKANDRISLGSVGKLYPLQSGKSIFILLKVLDKVQVFL